MLPVALFLLFHLNPLRWALNGALGIILEVVGQNVEPTPGWIILAFARVIVPAAKPAFCPSLFLWKSGGPKWTRTIDLTIISRVL